MTVNKSKQMQMREKTKDSSKKTLEGSIVGIIPKSGAIERCPECKRALVNNHCPVHLDVDPNKDLRIKAKLNTGKQLIINSGLAEKLIGLSIEDAHSLSEDEVIKKIKDRIMDREIKAEVRPINEEKNIYSAKDLQITR